MTSLKIEVIDDDVGPTSVLNIKKENSLQLPLYITENRENIKSAFKNSKLEIDLQEDKHEVTNIEQTTCKNIKNSFVNDFSSLKNKIKSVASDPSVKGGSAVNTNLSETLSSDNFSDSSTIYISCRFCKKGFETVKSFSNHVCRKKKTNSRIKLHKCKFCLLTFSQKQHLTAHIRGHTRNNCTLCNAQFNKRKALCKHLLTAHNVKEPERLYKCSVCDKHFSKRQSLNFHFKSHINNQFFCLTCCFMCDDEDTYNDHMKQHIKISKHECHLCQKKFVRRQQYDQHMTAHEKYLCSSCNITFSNKKLFMKHQHSVHHAENEKKHACLICKKLFVRRKYLEIHQRVHTGEKPVKCFHCENNFSDRQSLLKHMKTVKHLQRVSSQKGQKVEIEKPFLCSKCGLRFYQQQSLLRHIGTVHSATEFLKCPHCDYKSKFKTNFKRHLELHTDSKRFVCELCGLSFRTLATLKEHYVFVHSENREFICDVCKKGFKNKSTLQRHMRIHSESRPYKCFCNRDYKRMSHLKRHMISAHQMTLKKNQTPMVIKENSNLNPSLSEESVTALIKSLEALPDESSCDDFSVPHYVTTVSSTQAIVNDDSSYSHYIPITPKNHAKPLNDLSVNGDSYKELLPTENGDDSVPLNAVQKHPNSDVYIINEDSENTLNAFDLSHHLEMQSNVIPNSETSSASLEDATLSLSPSNYCNASSPLSAIPMENVTIISHSTSSQNVHSLTSIHNMVRPQSSPNLNFHTPTPNIDSFASFSNSDSPTSLSVPPFSLNSSPSHVTELNLEQNSVSEDFLSLPSYASSKDYAANCSPHFFSWDTDENSNTLKISNNDLAIPSTYVNLFTSNLTCSVNNLLPKELFANDSVDAITLKSEFDSLSDLC